MNNHLIMFAISIQNNDRIFYLCTDDKIYPEDLSLTSHEKMFYAKHVLCKKIKVCYLILGVQTTINKHIMMLFDHHMNHPCCLENHMASLTASRLSALLITIICLGKVFKLVSLQIGVDNKETQ